MCAMQKGIRRKRAETHQVIIQLSPQYSASISSIHRVALMQPESSSSSSASSRLLLSRRPTLDHKTYQLPSQ